MKANFLMSPPLVVAFAIAGTDRHRSHARAARGRRRTRGLSARRVAVDAGDRCAPRERVRSRRVPARLCRLRRPEPAVEPDPRRDGAALRVGPGVALHPRAAVLRSVDGGGPVRRVLRCAGARHLRRFDHDGPHQPGRRDQADLAGRRLPARARRPGSRTSTATARAAATTRSWSAGRSPTSASGT